MDAANIPKMTLTEILMRTPVGDTFFTEQKDTVVGSYAHRAGVRVSTERILGLHAGKRELFDLTRVTIVERTGETRLVRKEKIATASAESVKAAGRVTRERKPQLYLSRSRG